MINAEILLIPLTAKIHNWLVVKDTSRIGRNYSTNTTDGTNISKVLVDCYSHNENEKANMNAFGI